MNTEYSVQSFFLDTADGGVRVVKREVHGDCVRCFDPTDVAHRNCMYGGARSGHSVDHCTASACY